MYLKSLDEENAVASPFEVFRGFVLATLFLVEDIMYSPFEVFISCTLIGCFFLFIVNNNNNNKLR